MRDSTSQSAGERLSAQNAERMAALVESVYGPTFRDIADRMAALTAPLSRQIAEGLASLRLEVPTTADPLGPHHIVRSDTCRN